MSRGGGMPSQFQAVLGLFLREWPRRTAALAVPIVGAAGATFILVSVFAIANGISDAVRRGGEDHVAIVLGRDAQIETSSHLSDEDLDAIRSQASGMIVSPELVQTVDTLSRGGEAGAQVLARGVSAAGIQLRKEFRMIEGRMFTPGKLEVIVGRRLARDFAGLEPGTTLTGSTQEWAIVGVFEAGAGTAESEVWMDLESARTESGSRVPVSSVRVSPVIGSQLGVIREALQVNGRLQVRIAADREFQMAQFSRAVERVRRLSIGLALLLGVGVAAASVNTMSAMVAERERAVATLRALGFSLSATVSAVFVETTLLGLIGGVLGASGAWFLADGYGLSVLNGTTNTPFALSAEVTTTSLVQGVSLAVVITALAAIAPCFSVARRSVTGRRI